MNAIEKAAAECREACKECKVGDVMQHIHHGQWLEILTEPIENRISFILANKASNEQAERLRRMRPFDRKKADSDWQKADSDREKADADLMKADADWEKADADLMKAYADREKAYADWEKAYADWKKAYASPAMLRIHAEVCGCAWGLHTDIFGGK